jgi:predicted ATPase
LVRFGLPLAIELAASWIRVLSPRDLLDHLRQADIALAVFVGGFTREAAEAVAQADLGVLAALAERSLIQRLPDAQGGSRYQLHELVRHYALHHPALGMALGIDNRNCCLRDR